MKAPTRMNEVIGNVLRYGVLVSAGIIVLGTVLMVATNGLSDAKGSLSYDPSRVPHGTFDISLQGLLTGLAALQPFSIIELGAIVLIATPVSRVVISVIMFAARKDRLYVAITVAVLALLLFSIFVTPLIPAFQA